MAHTPTQFNAHQPTEAATPLHRASDPAKAPTRVTTPFSTPDNISTHTNARKQSHALAAAIERADEWMTETALARSPLLGHVMLTPSRDRSCSI